MGNIAANGKVVVVGSINQDVVATTDKHPRPGETVEGTSLARFPGGKGANQAVASSLMGAQTEMVGAVGDDADGSSLLAFLTDQGVGTGFTAVKPGSTTGTALITVANGNNSIVVVPGANGELDEHTPMPDIGSSDVVLAQHETPAESILAAFRRAKVAGALTLLNPAPWRRISPEMEELCDILVLNEIEFSEYAQQHEETGIEPEKITLDHVQAMADSTGKSLIVTLGEAGLIAVTPDFRGPLKGHLVDVIDTTGAGDCFCGTFAASLVEGLSVREALGRANASAAISVGHAGAGPSMPTAAEVDAWHNRKER